MIAPGKTLEDARIVLLTDSGAIPSLYVRFIDPIALVTANYDIFPEYDRGAELAAVAADLLVVQRWFNTPIRRIAEEAKARGIPLVYETDDNLLDLSTSSSNSFSPEQIDNMQAILRLADLVTCSTRTLAEAIAPFARRVVILENYGLPKPMVDHAARPHLAVVNTDYFKLAGTKQRFFDAIEHAVATRDYRASFFGSTDDAMLLLRDRHPGAVAIFDKLIDDRSAFLDRLLEQGVNVAAVPLDDTRSHSFKSDIKFLDFASIGVPGIFNNRRVYASVRHGIDGYLCEDDYDGWLAGLDHLAPRSARAACGSAARETMMNGRSISDYAQRLKTLYADLLGVRPASIPTEVEAGEMADGGAIDRVLAAAREKNGFFWLGDDLYVAARGAAHHVSNADVIPRLVRAGMGFVDTEGAWLQGLDQGPPINDPEQAATLVVAKIRLAPPPPPDGGRALRISWIVPQLLIGGGGHRNIIRCAFQLEQLGHRVSLYFTDSQYSGERTAELVREHFYPFAGHIGLLDDSAAGADILFATHWSTVRYAEALKTRVGEIVYFVQDFEPNFYAMGSEYVLAETTYRKGFYAITSGIWCEHFLRNNFGAEADHFQFPIDVDVYFDTKKSRKRRIIFFAKPEMQRRCFEIGVEALAAFHRLRPDVEIAFFGSSHAADRPLGFPVTQLGLLPGPPDLAELYNNSRLGVVFSTTNPSLVPYEMMACGLPIVDLARTGNEMNYAGRADIALLADPDPAQMAQAIARLIDDDADLAARAARGLEFTKAFPGEDEVGRLIETLLLRRVAAWGDDHKRRFSA